MLNDHESDFLNLLYSRKYLLKKSMWCILIKYKSHL
jgi:hypothetical protein